MPQTPQLPNEKQMNEEEVAVAVIYACVKQEKYQWAVNYLNKFKAQELESARKEEAKKILEILSVEKFSKEDDKEFAGTLKGFDQLGCWHIGFAYALFRLRNYILSLPTSETKEGDI